jgi:hypothetical protein
MPVQIAGDRHVNPFGIANHVIVPEPQNAVALVLNYSGALGIDSLAVLAAVNFDH